MLKHVTVSALATCLALGLQGCGDVEVAFCGEACAGQEYDCSSVKALLADPVHGPAMRDFALEVYKGEMPPQWLGEGQGVPEGFHLTPVMVGDYVVPFLVPDNGYNTYSAYDQRASTMQAAAGKPTGCNCKAGGGSCKLDSSWGYYFCEKENGCTRCAMVISDAAMPLQLEQQGATAETSTARVNDISADMLSEELLEDLKLHAETLGLTWCEGPITPVAAGATVARTRSGTLLVYGDASVAATEHDCQCTSPASGGDCNPIWHKDTGVTCAMQQNCNACKRVTTNTAMAAFDVELEGLQLLQ